MILKLEFRLETSVLRMISTGAGFDGYRVCKPNRPKGFHVAKGTCLCVNRQTCTNPGVGLSFGVFHACLRSTRQVTSEVPGLARGLDVPVSIR